MYNLEKSIKEVKLKIKKSQKTIQKEKFLIQKVEWTSHMIKREETMKER